MEDVHDSGPKPEDDASGGLIPSVGVEVQKTKNRSYEPIKQVNARTDDGSGTAEKSLPFFLRQANEADEGGVLGLADEFDRRNPCFRRDLMLVAAVSAGDGLDPAARPIVGVALRMPEIAPLLALAHIVANREVDRIHVVEFNGESMVLNSPGLLAEALAQEYTSGSLDGDTILFVVRENATTRDWEAATLGGDNPLGRFLKDRGKQLFLGFEVVGSHPMSRMINADNRIMPLNWALPMLAAIARRYEFSPDRIDPHLLERMEQAAGWHGPENDRAERGRFQQFVTGLKSVAGPAELNRRLERLLDDSDFEIETKWMKRRFLVDEAFGLAVPDASDNPVFPRGPAPIRQALLFAAAFCDRMPGRNFVDLVRASLEPDARVEFSHLLERERDSLREISALSGAENPVLPELPLLTDYFDRHADRLCGEYGIVPDASGHLAMDENWAHFPLASHIGKVAPVAAAGFARRLLTNVGYLGLAELVEDGAVIDMLASVRHHLASSFDDDLLVAWLGEHTFRPFVQDIAESHALGELAAELHQSGADSAAILAKSLQQNNHLKIALAAGWEMAETITLFLDTLRRIGETDIERDRSARHDERLLESILDVQPWPGSFIVAFCLGIILLDVRPPAAADRRHLYVHIRTFCLKQDRELRFVRRVVSYYLNLKANSVGVRFGPFDQAHRVFAMLADARRDPVATVWLHVQDVLTEHVLNFDIRWPPANAGLLSYAAMGTVLLTGRMMTRSPSHAEETDASAIEDHVFRHFLSVSPAEWLERSWDRQAALEAADRLRDTLMVLLDGVPAEATIWRAKDKNAHLDWLLQTLSVMCGTQVETELEQFSRQLASIADGMSPTLHEATRIRLYGLFWPALLVHWRLQLFGPDAARSDSIEAGAIRAFLKRLKSAVPPARVSALAEDLKILARACEVGLYHRAQAMGDRHAVDFYKSKFRAIDRMSDYLKRPAPGTAR